MVKADIVNEVARATEIEAPQPKAWTARAAISHSMRRAKPAAMLAATYSSRPVRMMGLRPTRSDSGATMSWPTPSDRIDRLTMSWVIPISEPRLVRMALSAGKMECVAKEPRAPMAAPPAMICHGREFFKACGTTWGVESASKNTRMAPHALM